MVFVLSFVLVHLWSLRGFSFLCCIVTEMEYEPLFRQLLNSYP